MLLIKYSDDYIFLIFILVAVYEEQAMKKAYQEHIEEKEKFSNWGKYYQNVFKEKEEHKKSLQNMDDTLLELADDQDERQHCFKMKHKYERKEKTIRNGAKQHLAQKLYVDQGLLIVSIALSQQYIEY